MASTRTFSSHNTIIVSALTTHLERIAISRMTILSKTIQFKEAHLHILTREAALHPSLAFANSWI